MCKLLRRWFYRRPLYDDRWWTHQRWIAEGRPASIQEWQAKKRL